MHGCEFTHPDHGAVRFIPAELQPLAEALANLETVLEGVDGRIACSRLRGGDPDWFGHFHETWGAVHKVLSAADAAGLTPPFCPCRRRW